MRGEIDYLIVGVGTGGTISGCGKFLKEKNKKIKVIGVDTEGSIYKDYFETGEMVEAHSYKVEGIGEDFLPSTMHFDYVDGFVRTNDKKKFHRDDDWTVPPDEKETQGCAVIFSPG